MAKYECLAAGCDRSFDSMSDCQEHLKKEHKDLGQAFCKKVEWRCAVCEEIFDSEEDCEDHARDAHGATAINPCKKTLV